MGSLNLVEAVCSFYGGTVFSLGSRAPAAAPPPGSHLTMQPSHLNTVQTARGDVVRVAAQSRPLDHRPAGHRGSLDPGTAWHDGYAHQATRMTGMVVQVLVVWRQVVVVVVMVAQIQIEIAVAIVHRLLLLAARGASLSPQRGNPRWRGSALLVMVTSSWLLVTPHAALHHGRGLMGGCLLVIGGVRRHWRRLLVVIHPLVQQGGSSGRMIRLGMMQAILMQARVGL